MYWTNWSVSIEEMWGDWVVPTLASCGRSGMRFSDCFMPLPICQITASGACFLNGQLPAHISYHTVLQIEANKQLFIGNYRKDVSQPMMRAIACSVASHHANFKCMGPLPRLTPTPPLQTHPWQFKAHGTATHLHLTPTPPLQTNPWQFKTHGTAPLSQPHPSPANSSMPISGAWDRSPISTPPLPCKLIHGSLRRMGPLPYLNPTPPLQTHPCQFQVHGTASPSYPHPSPANSSMPISGAWDSFPILPPPLPCKLIHANFRCMGPLSHLTPPQNTWFTQYHFHEKHQGSQWDGRLLTRKRKCPSAL